MKKEKNIEKRLWITFAIIIGLLLVSMASFGQSLNPTYQSVTYSELSGLPATKAGRVFNYRDSIWFDTGLTFINLMRAGSSTGDLLWSDTTTYLATKYDLTQIPTGTIQDGDSLYIRAANEGTVVGNKRGLNSVDLQTIRVNASRVASGSRSVVSGGYNNAASGTYSTVSGGFDNAASGTYSTVSGGYDNDASNNYSIVSGGFQNIASGNAAIVSGGFNNTAAAYGEWVGGLYSESVTGDPFSWIATQPIFRVGNGQSTSLRSDAFRINKNGDVFFYGDTARADTTIFKVKAVMFPDKTIQTTASTGGTGTTDSIYNEFTQEWLSNNDTSKRTGTYFIVDSIGFASGGWITGVDTTTAISGAKTASFSHDASVANVGAYTLSTSGAVVISILNLTPTPHRYMQGTIFLDIATNPSALTVNTYYDGGTTGLTEVVVGNPLANAANKMTTITYTAVNNGTEHLVTLVYGQEN